MASAEEVIAELRRSCLSKRGRMFKVVKSTWNVGKGCTHLCSYCNVWKVFVPKLQRNPLTRRYRDGFAVRLFRDRLRNPDYKKSGVGLVFIWYMGDWMCEAVPDEWIFAILEVVRRDPDTEFLSCTKNPMRYLDFEEHFPENLWLGTTIESNRPMADRFTKAPPVRERYRAMRRIDWEKKFLSIEPKMDCDPQTLAKWAGDMGIRIVEVGADNYGNNLPEPAGWKVDRLLRLLDEVCDLVVPKEGLGRLLGQTGTTRNEGHQPKVGS